jgi:dsDNA-specific endonuclease/ATPase MutS2
LKDDFWVGDLVFDENSGLQGKYEGKNTQNQVKINVAGKIVLLKHERLRLMTASEQAIYREALESELPRTVGKPADPKTYSNSIDLHIEILAPKMVTKSIEAILHRQISATRSFIKESIKKKQYQIIIIHGKGTGALKMEIDMLLHEFPQVHDWKDTNEGGATTVFLKYPVSF